MYGFPDMIDIGMKEKWKSPEHREAAIKIGICNPRVNNANILMELCEAVNKIPQDRLKTITFSQCIEEFNLPADCLQIIDD